MNSTNALLKKRRFQKKVKKKEEKKKGVWKLFIIPHGRNFIFSFCVISDIYNVIYKIEMYFLLVFFYEYD